MKIRFYPLDFKYKVKDDDVIMYVFAKLESGEKVCLKLNYEPYFYACNIDPKLLAKIALPIEDKVARVTHWEEVEKELVGQKQKFLKIYTNFPKAVPPISKELENWGADCYEKDILFVQRFMRDLGLSALGLAEAQGEFQKDTEMRVPVFIAKKIKPADLSSEQKLRILAVDIETYAPTHYIEMEKNPVLMIALSGEDEQGKSFRTLLTWKRFKHDLEYIEVVDDEEELLKRFREVIVDYNPEVLFGYNSDNFDLPYLQIRAKKYGLHLDFGWDRSEIEIRREAKISGILHLDLYQFIRNIFGKNMKTESFSLDNVAFELLGHRKHKADISKLYSAWDEEQEKLEEYCKYNMHDAELTLKLGQKLFLEMLEFARTTGLPLFDTIRMSFSKLVESFIMKKAIAAQVLAPNKPTEYEIERRRGETYEGGFVYEPKPGLYNDIVVLDFRSLYPSIITAHNIGPEGLRCECCTEKKVPGMEAYWFCTREKKFIPSLLEELINKRAQLKKALKTKKGQDNRILEARSLALKMLANSFYGYLGFFGARWYCLECARSTTAYARNYIKDTLRKAESSGFTVCYSDTDSCFLLLGEKSLDEAMVFMKAVNKDLPGQMELDFQGYYPKGLFVGAKGTEKGAKKKYALLTSEGGVKITGFETVRRNWSKISKEVQEQVLHLVLEEKTLDALTYVQKVVKELKAGKIPIEKLVVKTKITRDLERYTSVGPHVAVARKMQEKGYPIYPGMLIEYVIVKGSGIVRERAKMVEEVKEGEYDAEYYIHHQLIPAVSSIFAVLGYSEENIFSESSQTGLGKFFG